MNDGSYKLKAADRGRTVWKKKLSVARDTQLLWMRGRILSDEPSGHGPPRGTGSKTLNQSAFLSHSVHSTFLLGNVPMVHGGGFTVHGAVIWFLNEP